MTPSSNVSIIISQEEWKELSLEKREKIKSIMLNTYGYDLSSLDLDYLEEEED